VFSAGWTRITLVAGVVAASGWLVLTPAAASVTVNCGTSQLQPALSAAAPGSTVHVKGTCVGNFTIGVNLTVTGAPTATLDGGGIGTTLTITGAAKVTLEHLTITDGLASLGGGISAPSSAVLHLSHVVVADNLAYDATAALGTEALAEGGGIYASGGSLTLTSSTVEGNRTLAAQYGSAGEISVAEGGGMWTSGRLKVIHSTVTANQADAESGLDAAALGGGIYADGKELIVQATTVDANHAGSSGGSAFSTSKAGGLEYISVSGSATVERSHFDRNVTGSSEAGGAASEADSGGALLLGARVSVTNSTFDNDELLGHATGPGTEVDLDSAALSMNAAKSGKIVDSRIAGSLARGASEDLIVGTGGAVDAFGKVTIGHTPIIDTTLTLKAPNENWQGGALFDQAGATGTFTLTLDHDSIAGTSVRSTGSTTDAEMDGGAIYSEASTTITHTTISDNVANFGKVSSAQLSGGALDLNPHGGSTTTPTDQVSDSTITGNTLAAKTSGASGSVIDGGGVFDDGIPLKVTDSTLARNTVGGGGTAAIAGGGLYVSTGAVHVTATILADNSTPIASEGRDCFGTVLSTGYNLLGTKTGCAYAKKRTDKIGVSPELEALHANGGPTETLALKKTSPAVNAVPVSACPIKTDQRGVHRPQGPKCDIGAYELKPPKKHHKKH